MRKHNISASNPALFPHDFLHALIDADPSWVGEIQVAMLDLALTHKRYGITVSDEEIMRHMDTTVNALQSNYGVPAVCFYTLHELKERYNAAVRIIDEVSTDVILYDWFGVTL